eukprot:m.42127 g.42127  ORF g.42127 m.42127 type:complete len:54 (-) comp12859_c0_seq1:59-220(-)
MQMEPLLASVTFNASTLSCLVRNDTIKETARDALHMQNDCLASHDGNWYDSLS